MTYKEQLLGRLPNLTEDLNIETYVICLQMQSRSVIYCCTFCRTATVEVLGTSYKKGCCVLIGYKYGLPEFGQLLDIVVQLPAVCLVLKVLLTSRFYNHYFSYEVISTANPSVVILLPAELPDYQALHLHKVKSGSETVTLVTPKYDIDELHTIA